MNDSSSSDQFDETSSGDLVDFQKIIADEHKDPVNQNLPNFDYLPINCVNNYDDSDDDNLFNPQTYNSTRPVQIISMPETSNISRYCFVIKNFKEQSDSMQSETFHLEKFDMNLGMNFKEILDDDFNEIDKIGNCFVIFSNFKEAQNVQFHFRLVNQKSENRSLYVRESAQGKPDSQPIKKEYSVSLTRSDIENLRNGWINHEDEVKIDIEIMIGATQSNPYVNDSKKLTGYVGLKNQGATCYMNSMLQALFHLPAFRRIVYNMDSRNVQDETKSIPLNLQRLFCQMQFQDHACSTKALTKSFGWSDYESIMQHDIQEFCRLLVDNLEMKMKGTNLEKAIPKLFKGQTRQYIRCVNVPYESSKIEDFYDLSMQVKGCKNLQESFEKYVEKDRMDGNNQYSTDDYGKQDADMGVEFISFPSVLHLHLRRFEFDYDYETMVKINDRFEFPEEIDLSPFLAKDSEDITKSNIYDLYGVLIHMGAYGAGHYYAFLRTSTSPQWFKFDDEFVTKVDKKTAIIDNFGGSYENQSPYYYNTQKRYSAYMLVYVRREEANQLYEEIKENEIPVHLIEYMKKLEQDEIRKNEQQIQNSQTETVNVITQEDLEQFTLKGKSGFPKVPLKEHVYKLDETQTLIDLYQYISTEMKVDVNSLRIWDTSYYYLNPTRVLPMKAVELYKINQNKYLKEITIYVEPKPIEQPLTYPPDKSMVLFVKFYFPNAEEPIQYIGTINLDITAQVNDAIPLVNQLLEFPVDTPLLVFVDAELDSLTQIDPKAGFYYNSIKTGCFIVCQVKPGHPIPPTPFVCKKLIDTEPEIDELDKIDFSLQDLDESSSDFSDDFSDNQTESTNQPDQPKKETSETQNDETSQAQKDETNDVSVNVIETQNDETVKVEEQNIEKVDQKKKDVPLIFADDFIPSKIETVDKYLDKKLNTVIADVYNYNDQAHPLFSIQFVSSISFSDFKKLISQIANFDYNPQKDSIQLYIMDSYSKSLKMIGDDQTYYSTLASCYNYPKTRKRSFYFQLNPGISENRLVGMTFYKVEFSRDGYNIDNRLNILASKSLKTDELLHELKNNGVDIGDSEQNVQYRFYMLYNHKFHSEIQQTNFISSYYTIRVEVVPQDQRILKAESFEPNVKEDEKKVGGNDQYVRLVDQELHSTDLIKEVESNSNQIQTVDDIEDENSDSAHFSPHPSPINVLNDMDKHTANCVDGGDNDEFQPNASDEDDFEEVHFKSDELGIKRNPRAKLQSITFNNDYYNLSNQRSEELSADKLVDSGSDAKTQMGFDEFLIQFCYVYSDSYGRDKARGDPFWVKVIKGETFKEMKERIKANLKEPQLSRFMNSKFELCKKTYLMLDQKQIIKDDSVLSEMANIDDVVYMMPQNQTKKTKKKASYSSYEPALKIHN